MYSVFCQAFKATPTTGDILTVLCGLAGSTPAPFEFLFLNGVFSEITFLLVGLSHELLRNDLHLQ